MTPLDMKLDVTPADFQETLAGLREGRQSALQTETFYRDKQGREQPVEAVLQYLPGVGGNGLFVAVLRDIRARKQADAQLLQAKQAAEAANKAKSAFLANMSHELRTPLNGILGYTQLFRWDHGLSPQQREGIEVIHRSGEYLLSLINDILDLSKIEAGKLELSPGEFHLAEMLEDMATLFRLRAAQKSLSFEYTRESELPSRVYGDSKKFRQILFNLLSNAVKFTHGGYVRFSVDYRAPRIRFEIEDSGIGILPEEMETVFQPFEQGSRTRLCEGTGLGLAITRKQVEIMQGEMQVRSTPDQGSLFRVELPLPEVPGDNLSRPATGWSVVGYTGPRRKLLLLDGSPANHGFLTVFLERLGFSMATVGNSGRALEDARAFRPDLILLDAVMPGLNDCEVCRRLRAMPEFEQLPIVVFSASAFPHHRAQALAVGCNGFLSKPIIFEQVLEQLQRHLQLNWLTEEEARRPSPAEISPPLSSEAALSSQQASFLVDLTRRGDTLEILNFLDRLESEAGHIQPLTRQLRQLADNFENVRIREIAERFL
jgi:signal transduction histidine kinase/CheY-like chemotaxis protein